MIDVQLLGNGGLMPLPDRWLSSLLVRCNGHLTVFDCGEGTQIPWQRFKWGFRKVGAICLTHMHADHVAGLPGLLHAMAHAGRTEPVFIVGPAGTDYVVRSLRVIAPHLPYSVVVQEPAPGDTLALPGELVARVFQGDHSLPCYAYRLDLARQRRFDAERASAAGIPVDYWTPLQRGEPVHIEGIEVAADQFLGEPRPGLSLAFVTDTRPLPEMTSFLQGVDLLVCEGTYGDPADGEKAVERKHMTFAEAATLARDANAGELWLTHFSPAIENPSDWIEQATRLFPQTQIGFSGLTASLTFRDVTREQDRDELSGG